MNQTVLSKGAFTPTNSPCSRLFRDRPKACAVRRNERSQLSCPVHLGSSGRVWTFFTFRTISRTVTCMSIFTVSSNGRHMEAGPSMPCGETISVAVVLCFYPTHRFTVGKKGMRLIRNLFKGFFMSLFTGRQYARTLRFAGRTPGSCVVPEPANPPAD